MTAHGDTPERIIARRAAQELRPGDVVNLGVGIPMKVLDFVDPDDGIILHGENGMLGIGPLGPEDAPDPDLTNAGSVPVAVLPGGSFFSLLESGAMMRGGHLDKVLMGGFEVDSTGTLANWILSQYDIKGGIGGAMDLAVGARELIVLMRHTTTSGGPRLVRKCTLPPTAIGVVNRIITELAVIDVTPRGFVLKELLGDADFDTVLRKTDAPLEDGRT
jgi:3-oxoacid CoA-transferase B subunit